MRVLHVLCELRASGAEVMLRDAVPLFRSSGIEPVILSTGGSIGDFAEQYDALKVEVLHLPFERKWRHLRAFYRLVRAAKVDLVHLHPERANFVLAIAARAAGIPVVLTVHSVFTYEGRLKQQRRLERWVLRKLGMRHISISASVEENERKRLKNPTTRVDNWLGPSFRPPEAKERLAARTAFGVPRHAIVIATVGNCSEIKNHETVLEALRLLAGVADRTFVYLHAGHGPMEAQERELARDLAEVADIRFLGTVVDVRQLLWATDIFCMPSLYEGLGNAALEAIACGVPAVLSRVPGLVEVAEPSAFVQFVEPTHTGVAAGITALLDELSAARATGVDFAARVRAERSAAQSVGKMIETYRLVRSTAGRG